MSEVAEKIPASTLAALQRAGSDIVQPVETPKKEVPDEEEDLDKEKEKEVLDKKEVKEVVENENTEEQIAKDADLISKLKERGIDLSIDEIINKLKTTPKEEKSEDTPEEVALKKLKIKEWAISNKKVPVEKIEKFESDSQLSNLELAFKVYAAERNGETNPLTDEEFTESELRTEFEEENFLYIDDEDPRKKRSLKKIDLIAQTYLHDEYKELNSLDSDFNSAQNSAQNEAKLQNAISDVKSNLVKSGLSYAIKDELGVDIPIKLPLTQKALDKISVSVTDPSNTADMIREISKEYLFENANKILHEVATAYHSQKILGKKASSIGIELKKHEYSKNATVPESTQRALDRANANR